MFEPLSCSKSCNVWTRARTGGDAAEPGRLAVTYLQLAHNEWDPAAKTSQAEGAVLLRPRRRARPDAIERLIGSLTRLLDPTAARPPRPRPGRGGWRSPSSRPVGGAWLLDGLWQRLGIDTLLRRLAAGRGGTRSWNGCCSHSSRTGRWRRPRSWPRPAGSPSEHHRRPRQRRRLLPGHGLAPHGRTRSRTGVFDQGRPAQPRSRPDLLRHHQHLLRDRGPRRAGLA